jgi:ABC-2 type transport system ATP-binding protein
MDIIDVKNLTKRYPGRTAVSDISFRVAPGEIVGFLGPNGAGKTTTMRILSGFLPATGGDVNIGGRDVSKQSLEIRRHIGYLPESCPLYPEMRVSEYLRYRARLKGLPRGRRKERIRTVLEMCGLLDVRLRVIGHLSKGYRQRVGLADALVHDPELLILDEPTIGLDPNQIREIRNLIRDLSGKHTILLSTHILPEVEAICERVLILDKGKIVASDTPENLAGIVSGSIRVVAEIKGLQSEIVNTVKALPGVNNVSARLEGAWVKLEVSGKLGTDLRQNIFQTVVENKWTLRELRTISTTLEDVFGALTSGDNRSRG